ncbi:MAG: CDP-glycerol glycerophosphotransferase family protein, partial [Mycobacterium sp.]
MSGNLAIIAAEMLARNPPIPHTVLAYRERHGWRGALGTVTNEIIAAYFLGTSRLVVVDHHFFPLQLVGARSGSTTVQTWHACGAFKKFALSRADKRAGSGRAARERASLHRNYSLFLASSRFTAECYAEAFGQPVEKFVWDLGIPRTDLLFRREPAMVETIRQRVRIPTGRKVILYAPTFRGSITSPRSPNDLDLSALQQGLGGDHVLLLRIHPDVRSAAPLDPALAGFVIDVSDYPE